MSKQEQGRSIDKLFREGLADYSEQAPEYLWEKIEGRLTQKRRDKFFRFYTSLAASLALIISMSIGYYLGFYQSKHTTSLNLKQNEQSMPLEKEQTETKNYKESAQYYLSTISKGNTSKSYSDSSTKDADHNKNLKAHEQITASQAKIGINNTSMALSVMGGKEGFCTALASNGIRVSKIDGNDEERQSVRFFDRFYIAFSAAPIYSYRVVDGVQAYTLDNIEKPAVTFSTGLQAIFGKQRFEWAVGMYFTQMAIRIDNVMVQQAPKSIYFASYSKSSEKYSSLLNSSGNIVPSSSSIVISNSEAVMAYQYPDREFTPNGVEKYDKVSLGVDFSSDSPGAIFSTYLTQRFNYLEIPLNFQYNIVQRRFILGIQAGLNSNFLLSNVTYASIDGKQTKIGKTENIKRFNIASNLGLSMAIPLSSNVSFLIEPRFRYYLLSINKGLSVETHPYSYGIYTGIRLRY
ncbi:MAG: hypothetical protein N2662_03365 [Bacteroidales bacterium]|nr:hypothetical protein [Bacteroidales bacterium]